MIIAFGHPQPLGADPLDPLQPDALKRITRSASRVGHGLDPTEGGQHREPVGTGQDQRQVERRDLREVVLELGDALHEALDLGYVDRLAAVDFSKQIPKAEQRLMDAWQRTGTYAAGLALESAS